MPAPRKNQVPLKREREGYFIFDEVKPPIQKEPERTLLVAILERAIRDIIEPHHKPKIKHSARKWFVSDSVEEFSFNWIMREIFPDASRTYSKKILKYVKEA